MKQDCQILLLSGKGDGNSWNQGILSLSQQKNCGTNCRN
jgi:hypothetical protein